MSLLYDDVSVWNEQLQCEVEGLEYNFSERRGQLYLAKGECVDMEGAAALFEAIDPGVTAIETYGGPECVSYRKFRDGWREYMRGC